MQADLFSDSGRRGRLKALGLLMLTALAARLPAMIVSGSMGESLNWPDQNAPSLWKFALNLLQGLAKATPVSEATAYKFLGVAGDLGLVVLLYVMLSRLAPDAPPRAQDKSPPAWTSRAFWLAMVYAAHPLAVLVSASVGDGGSLAILAVMASAWFVEFSDNPRSDLFSALCFGVALSLRVWPVALMPVFLKNFPRFEDRWRFACFSLVPAVALTLPWMVGGLDPVTLAQAKSHGLVGLVPSLGMLVGLVDQARVELVQNGGMMLGYGLLVSLGLAYLLGPWRFSLLPGLALSTLTLLVFLPGVSVEALLWLLPLTLALPGGLALRHGLFAFGVGLLLVVWMRPSQVFVQAERFQPLDGQSLVFTALWVALNLGLWYFWAVEWWRLLKMCRRPARLRFV